MAELRDGRLIHIVGRYNFETGTGTIDYVTPVRRAIAPAPGNDARLELLAERADNSILCRIQVAPHVNSCEFGATAGVFQEVVAHDPDLACLRLLVEGREVARYQAADPIMEVAGIRVEALDAPASNRKVLTSVNAPPDTHFTVQMRAVEDTAWITIAIGLDQPDTEIDPNQFPEAAAVELRVLATRGFEEREVYRDLLHD